MWARRRIWAGMGRLRGRRRRGRGVFVLLEVKQSMATIRVLRLHLGKTTWSLKAETGIFCSLYLSLCVLFEFGFAFSFRLGPQLSVFHFFFGLLILKMALFFSLCLFVEYEFLLVMVSGMGSSFIDVFNSVNTFFEKEKIELCE